MIDKVVKSVDEALEGLEPGMSIAVGGFGTCGAPATLIDGIVAKKVGELTAYSNNPGTELDQIATGLSRAVAAGLVKRFCGSFVGYAKSVERLYLGGEMEIELIPQGSLVERMRAGGAGIPAFYTPSGAGTPVSDGGMPMRYDAQGNVVLASQPKETRTFVRDGVEELCVLEEAITTDFSIIHAWKGDREGNLQFRYTAENFNPVVGMCGRVTVAEVENLVEVGELAPGEIQLQGIFVDRVLPLTPDQAREKLLERVVTRNPDEDETNSAPLVAKDADGKDAGWTREGIAARAAKELVDGSYVNLGIGLPTMIPDFIGRNTEVIFHSENGLLKTGPSPLPEEVDADVVNAGKFTTTIAKGGSTFDSMRSFDMIRGKHIDTAVLGALQVSQKGDIANWIVPGMKSSGMGGAMDLVKGARRVIAIMEHVVTESRRPRLLKQCTYPLTALSAVDLVITNLGVFEVTGEGLELLELAPGATVEQLRECTEPDFGTSRLKH